MQQVVPKKRITFIGFLLIVYYSLLACDNRQIFLYGGFILLCGFIVLDKLLSSDRMKIIFPTGCKWLYYFGVYCYFSRLWAWEPYYVSNLCSFLIPNIIFVFVCINYFIKIKNSNAIIAAIAVSGVALCAYVIIKAGGPIAFYNSAISGNVRLGGEITNVNNIGMAGAVSTVILLYYGIFQRKYFFLFVSIIPFIAAAASGSRKSILLLAVGIFFIITISQKNRNSVIKFLKIIVGLLLAIVVVKFILSLEIMSTVSQRLDMMFAALNGDSFNADGSTLMRKRLIEIGWNQFLQTPYLGVGLGNSVMVNGQAIRFWTYSHNDYIEHLVNGGVFSFLLYYGHIVYLGIRHIKLMKIRKDPEIVISFIIIVMYIVMSGACVTYYSNMNTYLYFILWITVVETKKMEFTDVQNS